MTKKYFKGLVRKMNVLPIILMAVMSVGFVSCGDDKDDIDTGKIVSPEVDENEVKGTTWKNTDSFSDGSKIITEVKFSATTAVISITYEQGLTSETTKMNYNFTRSKNLVVFSPQEAGNANIEGLIENGIKMTLTNMSNNSEIAVVYKQ
jgi:hypothetical protein